MLAGGVKDNGFGLTKTGPGNLILGASSGFTGTFAAVLTQYFAGQPDEETLARV